MKSAKILLTAIGLIAVIGGALAYNARLDTKIYTVDPAQPLKGCTVAVGFRTLDPIGNVVQHTFVSTKTTSTCQALDIYAND